MAAKETDPPFHLAQTDFTDRVDVPILPITPSTDSDSSETSTHTDPSLKAGPMELVYNELLHTVAEATKYQEQGGKHSRHLKLHIAALKEDAEIVGTMTTTDDELRTQAAQLVCTARRLRRAMERDIVDLQIEEESQASSVDYVLAPSKDAALKLAPLQLPTFDGESNDFHIFRSFFEENILHNKSMTDTAKWLRLKESLKGHPAEVISEIPQSGQTLHVAWKLILEIYGGDDKPIVELYTKLQQLSPSSLDTQRLRLTHSKLEGLLMSLSHLGHDAEANHFVRWTYLQKFPVEIMYQAQKRKDTPLSELRTAIGDIIAARECTDHQRGAVAPRPGRPSDRAVSISTPNTTTKPPSTKKPASFPKPLKCVFCDAAHWNDACTIYKTLDSRKQKLAGRCFKCLRVAHPTEPCLTEKRCFHCDNPEHNRALCPVKFGDKREPPTTQLAILSTPTTKHLTGNFLTFVASATSEVVQTPIQVRVVVDTAGGATLATQRVVDALHLSLSDQLDHYSGLDGAILTEGRRSLDEIKLTTRDDSSISFQPAVIRGIIPDVPTADVAQFRQRNPEYHDVFIPGTGAGSPIDILLGSDMIVELLEATQIKAINADTLLLPTKFGALIVGRQRRHQRKVCHSIVLNFILNPLQQMSEMDLVGLTGLDQSEIDEEERAIQQFYETVRFVDGRYSISWPWRVYPPLLDTNYGLALGRLRSLHKRLQKTPELLNEYHGIILKQLQTNIIEKVSSSISTSSVTHHLPHHPVLQPHKSTAVRPVYDGSSASSKKQKSLNDNIRKGTKWLSDLFGTLLRFRRYPTVVVADIARAFHQISINETDRDAARFLWLQDPQKPPTTENIQVYRFTRVAFGIIASPFLLNAVIRHHANQQPPNDNLKIILRDLYADNLVTSLQDTVNAHEFYKYAKGFFGSMAMNLTKWATNDDSLRTMIPTEDQLAELIQSVLGIRWNIPTDELSIKPPHIQQELLPTPRSVARDMAIRFDPMGWAAPIILIPKLFFRKIWENLKRWDVRLDETESTEWAQIATKLNDINKIRLPRCFPQMQGSATNEIHAFVDASASAYAVVVYLRIVTPHETAIVLLAAKSRLTPKKTVSIPRLELVALLLGCRFVMHVKNVLEMKESEITYIWSDSKCALAWMRQNKILPPILDKYVSEAKKYHINHFRYVPSTMNYADVATRGVDFAALQNMNWWSGPAWLMNERNWPCTDQLTETTDANLFHFPTKVTCKKNIQSELEIEGVATLVIGEFSSLPSLLKRTAYCLLALIKFRKQNFLQLQTNIDTSVALQWWLYWDQNRIYALDSEPEAGKPFHLNNIAVFRDQHGIIRCHTRIVNSCSSIDTLNPILLVQKSTLTKLIVLHEHEKLMHAGTAHTLANIRKHYWLPHGRREIYSLIHTHCFVCRKHLAQPFSNPPTAPLPEFRVTRTTKPFQNIGVDICGPFFTRLVLGRGQPKVKRWVILFTCAVIRAIHVEILQDMTTPEVMLAFRRFFGRKGVPSIVLSDNAPQFHVLDGCFKNLWQDLAQNESMSSYFAKHKIIWKFIPELAPWMGGMYERLIQGIKLALEKTYGNIIMLDRQFETTMIEIESVINSRPLAYVDREPDSPIITPNDFLMARFSAIPMQDTVQNDDDLLKKLWRSSQTYLNSFWTHWANHYLLLLRERNDQFQNPRNSINIQPTKGDVVVMVDLSKKRSSWQTAVIERLIHGNDKQIRAAQIKIPNGARLIRPITALAPLQIKMDLPNVTDEQLNADRNALIHSLPESATLSEENVDGNNVESDSEEESREAEITQHEEFEEGS